MLMDSITLLLTLKGRHLHTLRWMWHANKVGLPCQVLIADGEVHPTVAKLLESGDHFKNVNYRYLRYDDRTFSAFFRKCADALSQVKTPFVMMVDNDDFVFPSGLQTSADFLMNNPDYVCSAGRIASFEVQSRTGPLDFVIGPMQRLGHCYGLPKCSLERGPVAGRAVNQIRHYQVVYYNLYRRDALQSMAQEVVDFDFGDLLIHEYFLAMRTCTLGKVRMDPSYLSYARQRLTSSQSAYKVDFVYDLLGSRLPDDFRSMSKKVAAEAGRQDGVDPQVIEEDIRVAYAALLRQTLSSTVLRQRFPKLFRLKEFLRGIDLSRYRSPQKVREQGDLRFWGELSKQGCPQAVEQLQRRELESAEETLTSKELENFMRVEASSLF